MGKVSAYAPRPPLPSPHLPPGEGAPPIDPISLSPTLSPGRGSPPPAMKKEGWGFPLSRLAGGRWERGPGGEVQGCGTSGGFDGAPARSGADLVLEVEVADQPVQVGHVEAEGFRRFRDGAARAVDRFEDQSLF